MSCPDGIDVFFDNSAGPLHDAVMRNLALGARITICGQVSLADRFDEPDMGERFLRHLMIARGAHAGLLGNRLRAHTTTPRESASAAG